VETLGKVLLVAAILLAVVGGLLLLFGRLGMSRLPGDVVLRGKNVTVYAPIGLMIVLSIVLTIALNLFLRR
jgi:multisubunit Na+/H+ antiporter MnhG subunit